jgi:hypothetical protein
MELLRSGGGYFYRLFRLLHLDVKRLLQNTRLFADGL